MLLWLKALRRLRLRLRRRPLLPLRHLHLAQLLLLPLRLLRLLRPHRLLLRLRVLLAVVVAALPVVPVVVLRAMVRIGFRGSLRAVRSKPVNLLS